MYRFVNHLICSDLVLMHANFVVKSNDKRISFYQGTCQGDPLWNRDMSKNFM